MYPSAEIGDLDSLENMTCFRDTVMDMQALLAITPEVAVCDLHPGYESNTLRTGERVARSAGAAPFCAYRNPCWAETGRKDPLIGVAFDGTGYGPDGTVWGGEFLLASATGYQRVAYLKPLRFIGSDESVRQGWEKRGLPPVRRGADGHCRRPALSRTESSARRWVQHNFLLQHGGGCSTGSARYWVSVIVQATRGKARQSWKTQP